MRTRISSSLGISEERRIAMKRRIRKIWVPKCIVDLERETKYKWAPKTET